MRSRKEQCPPLLTPEEVKTRLKQEGMTLKQWAELNDFRYQAVSQVLRGVNRATFGDGHRIAKALGLK
ncbi:hypothetical protein GCM10009107_36160 [Ideonella azotifigens]|uniref:DNA-binding protein n=1 Tax=Ideonella azotifigens TaxID=513160 RepID=A0ABN1K7A2_9BURK